ncbi:MAG TPA: multicopper oxidase family protein [Candidatus Cybelea sp.]|jgi:FtsP/CotA-like multicopper oxidase with cupredoxin domain|nr:multicopper oxidase family protein [Candidatus Cybelea sp.]
MQRPATVRSAIKLSLALALAACGGGGGPSGPGVLPPPNPPSSGTPFRNAPAVRARNGVAAADLRVTVNPSTGLPAFEFGGKIGVAPTFDVSPGDRIVIRLHNALTGGGMQNDINLHFHGMSVSPRAPGDDVLTMMASPGETLHYDVLVPKNQQPGLYWYHPHIHGETNYQVGLAGMSGAIVVEGLSQSDLSLAKMKERIIIVRDVQDGPGSRVANRPKPMDEDQNAHPCGPDQGVHLTTNNVVRPTIRIAPGESQFFRVVNATGHRHLVLQVDGQQLQVVAIDGYALNVNPGDPPVMNVNRYVIPVAGRVEFVVTGPASGTSELRTLCYNSGPGGDPDPPEILADIRAPDRSDARDEPAAGPMLPRLGTATVKPLVVPKATTQRLVRLTEDANGFYINGQAFQPDARAMFSPKDGTVEQWTVLNLTQEVHDFHMHQVHFLVQSINDAPVTDPHWADTIVVPPRIPGANGTFKPGSVVVLADFRSPAIRGMSLFHCHILDHEDAGMMAKMQIL